jgi:baculoviral IAP repeat-containing protein 5
VYPHLGAWEGVTIYLHKVPPFSFCSSQAGFYFAGTDAEPDLARCYYCRRELDGWDPTDDPWEEHKRRECAFIKMGKKPEGLRIEDMATLEAARARALMVRINGYVLQ